MLNGYCPALPGAFQRLLMPFGRDALVPQCAPEFDSPRACTCGRCKAGDGGKVPRTQWKEPPSASELATWARRWADSPASVNWGVHLGRAQLVAVDVDPRHDGWATLARLLNERGDFPVTPRDRSAGGGRHYYFRAPAGFDPGRASAELGPGVEVLAGNHLVTIPPSIGPSGRWYLWDVTPWQTPFATVPSWLLAALEATRPIVAPPDPRQARYAAMARTVLKDRTVENARAYLRAVPVAVQGQGGYKATNAVMVKFCRHFDLPENEALDLLREWNSACNPPWPFGQLRDKYLWARERVRTDALPTFKKKKPLASPANNAAVDQFPELSSRHHAKAIGCGEPFQPKSESHATAELLRLRHNAYKCVKPRTVLTKSVNWKTGKRTVNLIDPRCDAWHCPACSSLHKAEWQVNYRLRLTVEMDPDGPAYVAECPIGRQKLYTDRIRRLGGRYFFLSTPADFNVRVIVSDVPFSGSTETTRKEACDWLCRMIEGYDGSKGKPGGSCRAWQLPKPPASDTSAHVCLGVCPGGLDDDQAEQVTRKNFLDVQGIAVPTSRQFLVLRWRTIAIPDGWSHARIDRLAARLMAAAATANGDARDQPYGNPCTDGVSRAPLTCYADIPD